MQTGVRINPFSFLRVCAAGAALFLGLFPGAARAADLPPLEEITAPSPMYARADEVWAEAKRLRLARDMDGLEALAAQLRQSKEALEGGPWLLSV
ncbi:MAG TPA: hypothetical protein VIS74_01480, partial [Chthoniobacterales bacterium]